MPRAWLEAHYHKFNSKKGDAELKAEAEAGSGTQVVTKQKFTEVTARALAISGGSFASVEGTFFRAFTRGLGIPYIVSRGTMANRFKGFRKELLDANQSLVRQLKASGIAFSVVSDLWSDVKMRCFLGVNIVWLDVRTGFFPEIRLIAVRHFPGEHNGLRICNLLIEILEEVGIPFGHIIRMPADSGANLVSGINYYEQHHGMRLPETEKEYDKAKAG